MLDLLLIIIAVELGLIIWAQPETRKIAGALLKLAGVALAVLAGYVLYQNAPDLAAQFHLRHLTLPPWQELATFFIGALFFVAAILVCDDAARGWVGERLVSQRAPDQPLHVLLASVAGMVFVFSALFLEGGLETGTLLTSEERIWRVVGGGLGDALVFAWVVAGLHRLYRRGGHFQTLKVVALLRTGARSLRSRFAGQGIPGGKA